MTRALSAFTQTSIISLVDQSLRFLKVLILARLLGAEDFGLFGIAIAVLAGLQVFSNFGLRTRFLSKHFESQSCEAKWLNGIWTIELIRNGIVFLFIVAISGWVSGFFGDSRLTNILVLVALSPLFIGATNVGIFLLEKRLEYRRILVLEVAASVGGFLFCVLTAYLLRDAIVLALALVSHSIIRCYLSFKIHPFRPKLEFDYSVFLDCFHYGKYLLFVAN